MTVHHVHPDPRLKILAEAERLFRHYGYAKTTMADIADACQMSPANLYRFFESKSALVEAICGQITTEAERRLFEIVRSDEPASRRLERFIAQIHKHTLENLLDHKKVHEMVVIAMQEQWHAVKAHLDRVSLYIEQIIKDGIASGEFAQQDSARAAKCVHSGIAHLCHPVIVAQKLDDEGRVTPEEMARFLINGLKAKG
jgi:AcrR family transcriptional regulator